jgi:trk system potassium uptake protein TrkH
MTIRQGRRVGDRRVRIERVTPVSYEATPVRIRRPPPPPAIALATGFAALIAIGTLLLTLPISSASGSWTRPIDALFTATSAVCVTGLVVLDTGTHWSGVGQAVIFALFQLGGVGFMAGSTFFLLVLGGRRAGLRDRMVAQATTGVADLGSAVSVLRRVALFALVVEVAGAILLTAVFLFHGRELLDAVWYGAFHAVSAFNNAGFDLMGGFASLTAYDDDPLLLGTVGGLIILGGLGYVIVGDVVFRRRWSRLSLESRLVLPTTLVLLLVGTAAIAAFEWSNPATLGSMPEWQRVLNAGFESTTLRTAGFSALPTGELATASLFVVIVLMFIGGASGSTAGGIKVNTFSLLLVAIISTARGWPYVSAFGRRIPDALVYRGLSVALLSVAAAIVFSLGLQLLTGESFIAVVFEAISAVGTVGASTGITPDLPDPARLWLVPAMFLGRLGPLTLALALAARTSVVRYRPAEESIRIG